MASVKQDLPLSGVFTPKKRTRPMLVSMVSPSITRVTSTSGQPAQLITVCGGPGPIAGSDGIAGVLPLEQATAIRTANTVVARVRRMCHRVDPEGGLLLEGRWRSR